ncbi:hypothetical protein ABPG74_016262 [Tetrahymena malaccensis]
MYSIVARSKNIKGRDQQLPRLLVTGCAGSIGKMIENVFLTIFEYDLVGVDRDNRIQYSFPLKNDILGSQYHKLDYIYQNDQFCKQVLSDKLIEKVAHLAEVSREEANQDYNLAKKYNVEGTKLLIQNIKDHCDLSKMHIFFRSDMSVYGDRTANPLIKVTDTPKPNPQDYYALTKLEAENIIKESGIPYTIMRFAPICDHLTQWVDLHPSYFYFELDQKIEWITARDAAKAIRQGLYKSNQIDKQTYNIGGGSQLVMRHRNFMKELLNARGVMIDKTIDLDPRAFANTNLYGGIYEDSDYSNSVFGYRMQPIDTAYLRQNYRYPFFMRWINKRIPYKYIIENHYKSSHIFQSVINEDEEFVSMYFDKSKVLPKDKALEKLENELAVEQDEIDLKNRQLRNAQKKAEADFIEACKQRDIREAIEQKWRIKRQELIANGLSPDSINLDEVEKLEAEDLLRRQEAGEVEEEKKEEKKELTEEEKQRLQEQLEDEEERDKSFNF